MSIHMVGIDHNLAPLDVRAAFSFTKKNAVSAMEIIQDFPGIEGCVLLATCNRLELWVSADTSWSGSLVEYLCRIKGLSAGEYLHYFVERSDEEAVAHLFALSCGLKSQILGEDQIITQVKDALTEARENGFTDGTLEVLFRMAVTAGKKVKSEVVFPKGNVSAIDQAVFSLKQKGIAIDGKTCMVIGNGEMGRLTARAFVNEGAEVHMTLRQYTHGRVQLPDGCQGLDYGDRAQMLPRCDFVVSATSSPHYTITRDMLRETDTPDHGLILIDLAVPRDIEREAGELEGVTLYDIDDFKADSGDERLLAAEKKARAILDDQKREFYGWLDGRELMPRIQFVKTEAVNDLNLRLSKVIRAVSIGDGEKDELLKRIDVAAEKVVNKLIFGLRDALEQDAFAECVAGLEQLYEE